VATGISQNEAAASTLIPSSEPRQVQRGGLDHQRLTRK